MANLTDPLITSIQGSDPQNLMEYITRQKIYDSRYWKEECFGLAAVNVLEKASTLKTIGGLPTKFLALTLKLLQLQPDADDIIESFIQQEDFKYVRALGAFYLRLTGRPAEIYEELEPLYRDYRKLRKRLFAEWSIVHMDEFIHSLLTGSSCLGIALPRLPARSTLQEGGYMDDGPRPTGLQEVLEQYGGPSEYLKVRVDQNCEPAISLWKKRNPVVESQENLQRKKRNDDEHDKTSDRPKKKQRNYGSLFKEKKSKTKPSTTHTQSTERSAPEENSEEYWNEQRAKLGLKSLKK